MPALSDSLLSTLVKRRVDVLNELRRMLLERGEAVIDSKVYDLVIVALATVAGTTPETVEGALQGVPQEFLMSRVGHVLNEAASMNRAYRETGQVPAVRASSSVVPKAVGFVALLLFLRGALTR